MATQIARQPSRRKRPAAARRRAGQKLGSKYRASLTVQGTPEECYQVWHDVSNLPRFLSFVDAVKETGPQRSHWVAREKDGSTIEWDAAITDDPSNRVISWKSLPGQGVETSATVRFESATGDRGTAVHLELVYRDRKRSFVTRFLAPILPGRELHRFKQWHETGEVTTTEGQSSGRRGPMGRLMQKREQ